MHERNMVTDINSSTNGRPPHNGSPHDLPTIEKRPPPRVNNQTIYGTALIAVVVFKFLMPWRLGVRPELLPTTMTLVAGFAGIVLIVLGRRECVKDYDPPKVSGVSLEMELSWQVLPRSNTA